MSGFSSQTEDEHRRYFGENTEPFEASFENPQQSQTDFNFQNFHYNQSYTYPANTELLNPNNSRASFMASPPQYYGEDMYSSARHLSFTSVRDQSELVEEEPPLLEELGIDPERIMVKTFSALNPFRQEAQTNDINFLLRDSDLAGPLVFCLALASCLLFSGKSHFGYVYGLAVTCCLMMYILLNLMSNTANSVTLSSVTSILGYCILPIVGLAALGVFVSLRTPVGLILSVLAVTWCSLSSSRQFTTILMESSQRPLIAYPCALLYGAFALVAIF